MRQSLAFSMQPDQWANCYSELSQDNALGYGFDQLPGFYVGLCLQMVHRLAPDRCGDPEQEILLPMGPTEPTVIKRLRKLKPRVHCVLAVVCSSPNSFFEINRLVTHPTNQLLIGCWPRSLAYPSALVPPWSPPVVSALLYCPLRQALHRSDLGLNLRRFLYELKSPSMPTGRAGASNQGTSQGTLHACSCHRCLVAADEDGTSSG